MYSLDFRKLALRKYEKYRSLRFVAVMLSVSHSTVSRWLKNIIPRPYKRTVPTKTDKIIDFIHTNVLANPFISLCDLSKNIKDAFKFSVSKELVRTIIVKKKFTRKKARFYGQPKNLEEKTKAFIEKREEFKRQQRSFVSIDETSFGRNNVITYGYAKKGEKLFVKRKEPRITTASSICCVCKDSIIGRKEVQGSVNSTIFLDFIKSLKLSTGTVILLDNAKIHHVANIKDYCSQNNLELLYVPPYSPWFNPIELCFSIVKRCFYQTQNISIAYSRINSDHLNAFFEKSLNCEKAF